MIYTWVCHASNVFSIAWNDPTFRMCALHPKKYGFSPSSEAFGRMASIYTSSSVENDPEFLKITNPSVSPLPCEIYFP